MPPPFAAARKEPSGFMNKVKSKINKLADHLPDSWGGDKGPFKRAAVEHRATA